MNKQRYASTRFTMAAGRQHTINLFGTSFQILYNSLETNPEVSIGGGPFYEIPQGVGVKKLEPFNKLEFKNPAGSDMTLWVAITEGEIEDARAIFTAMLSVLDVSDAVTTPAATKALDLAGWLINAAAAVNKGGGKVGIPVTGQPFAAGESVTITGTVNYNGAYPVDATSSANEVVIVATYVAETFDGVDDTIKPTGPRSIAAGSTRKELVLHNHDAAKSIYWGSSAIDPATYRGIPIPAGSAYIITCTAAIYFAAESGTGVAGCVMSINELTKS